MFHEFCIKINSIPTIFNFFNDNDHLRRLSLWHWAQLQYEREARFPNFVLSTDLATFHKNGHVVYIIFIIRLLKIPTLFAPTVKIDPIVILIIGSHFLEEKLTRYRYLHFLRENFRILLN